MFRAKLILASILLIVCAQLQCIAACATPPDSDPPCHHHQERNSNCSDHPLVSQAAPVAAPFVPALVESASILTVPFEVTREVFLDFESSSAAPPGVTSAILRV